MMKKRPSLFTSLLATIATNNNQQISTINNNNVMTSLASSYTTTSTTSSTIATDHPILKGVIFDMDGTLTKPNLDFGAMYRRCGIDPTQDILECVAQMVDEVERDRVVTIINEMEEEGRQTMQILPGAMELIQWLQAHDIPMALVTRNTYATTQVLSKKLEYTFAPIIARDDDRYPPKPNPTALVAIAQQWQISLPSESLLMLGDSYANDVLFGKNAGVRTALLVHPPADHVEDATSATTKNQIVVPTPKDPSTLPDFVTSTLWELPLQLWQKYRLASPLGSIMTKLAPPQPTTELAKAAATGDLVTLQQVLNLQQEQEQQQQSVVELGDGRRDDHIDPDNANTALIWAVEYNQTMVVTYLLQNHDNTITNVNHRGYLGNTAVARAARHGNLPILQLLLDIHNTQQGVVVVDWNLANDKLQYPLHIAAFHHHVDVVQLLLKAGANPLVLDRKGRTPAQDTSHPTIRNLLQTAANEKYNSK